MRVLENITYDELQICDYATFTQTLSAGNLLLFAVSSGSLPSATLDLEIAKKSLYKEDFGYAMWVSELISTAFAKVIPGPGSIYLEQKLKFHNRVEFNDILTVKLTVQEKREEHRVVFNCEVRNQDTDLVVTGESIIIAPTDKISLNQTSLPSVNIES